MSDTCSQQQKDWVATPGGFALGWGLPSLGLVAAMFLDSPAKAILWPAALVWMGIACLANAARCRRMHCYFTGPFFLLMALLSLLHGFEIVWIGPQGWTTWIGLTVGGRRRRFVVGVRACVGEIRRLGAKRGHGLLHRRSSGSKRGAKRCRMNSNSIPPVRC